MTWSGDSLAAIRAVAFIAAIGQIAAGGQLIANRTLFERTGPADWKYVRRTRHSNHLTDIGDRVLSGAGSVITAAVVKLVAAAATMVMAASGGVPLWPVVALVIANAVIAVRAPLGLAAADHVGNMVFVALALGLAGGSEAGRIACLVFVALEGCLAYLSAGISKVKYAGWRNGSFLREIVSTECFGRPGVAAALRRSDGLTAAVAWSVLAGECLFPLVLALPTAATLTWLGAATAFHLVVAFVMGLDTFVWAFTATYPAILFAHALVQRATG